MLHTQSPWLYELKNRRRAYEFENCSPKNDVVIAGGGIAGVVTAYYLLTLTKKNVLILEGQKIASGATGHNAGQLTAYLEKPFGEIVEQYGETLAIEAQKDINSAWELLSTIKKSLNLKTPIYLFKGLSGCKTAKPVYTHLRNRFLRPHVPHPDEFCFIADDCPFLDLIPSSFADLYTLVPRRVILDLLETKDQDYCAAFTAKKGCMNSAMFCEEILELLLKKYPGRFQVYENALISNITLNRDEAKIVVNNQTQIIAKKIVLCTNGFRNLTIVNKAGKTINTKFHEAVHGVVGFMKAYTVKDDNKPIAISYYHKNEGDYFYLTRRPTKIASSHNIIAIGGADQFLPDKSIYSPIYPYPADVLQKMDVFIKQTRINEYKKHYQHEFVWHGLMGYTKKGLRLIGPDKYNPVLIYNLGCNGVGILPSIFGGKKIALFLNNRVQKKSIFDPYF